jgi:hypothetical protein
VVWNIPCDPSNTAIVSPAFPRLAGEGLLCYIIRVFEAFISGGTEVFSPFLNWTFTGNGSTTTYSLPNATALLSAAYLVYIDGVVQAPVNYTIASGNPLTIVFSTAIPNGSQVVIVCMGSASQGTLDGVTINGATINTATINNLTATGTLALPAGSVTSTMILNGTIVDADINAAAAIATSKLAPVTATGSTTARSLPNRFADVVNVKDFGAIGNGVADDTAAIQAAVNSTSPFGEVFFPEGTYKISSTITLPSSSGLSGITLRGIGWGSVIKPTSAVSIAIRVLGDVVFISNLQFDGISTSSAAGIQFEGGLNNFAVSVTGCYFSTFANGIILLTDCYNISNNNFTNCNVSIYCADSAMNAVISNNYVLGGSTAVWFGRVSIQAEGVRVFGNTFLCTGAGANQITILAGLEISIFNNIIDQTGVGGRAIYISGSSGSSISHIKIRDNWLAGGNTIAGQCVQVAQGSGLNTNNIWINGNTFTSYDPNTIALTINTVSNYWVTNNNLYGTGTLPFSGTPFIVVGSNNGNVYGNQNFYGTSFPALTNNTFNYPFVVSGSVQATSFNNSGLTWTTGSGSPEGVVTAAVGSLYSNGGGSTSTTLYVKTNGSGNTGWTAK